MVYGPNLMLQLVLKIVLCGVCGLIVNTPITN